MVRRLTAIVVVVLAFASLVGCAVPRGSQNFYGRVAPTKPPLPAVDVSQADWNLSRARLSRLRGHQPTHAYVQRVKIAIVDPRTGKRYEARGALAVNPGQAARMLLLGPGGATALDVWVTNERFRFVVPPLNLEKRGGQDPEEMRGLPIAFLRWWFLSPLEGRLLAAHSNQSESAWLLRDGDATTSVRTDGTHFVALRRSGAFLEGMKWNARSLVPQAGASGVYLDGRVGLRIEVFVEAVLETEPEPAAFDDPDQKGTDL